MSASAALASHCRRLLRSHWRLGRLVRPADPGPPGGGATSCAFPRRGQARRMAGHSKWQNIRHIKGAKDRERSDTNAKVSKRIRIAVREGGGAEPKYNTQLARVVAEANKLDVPKTVIENAIKSSAALKDSGAPSLAEGKGPGNFLMVIELFTDSMRRTRMEIQKLLKQSGGVLGDAGFAMHAFDQKGVIHSCLPREGTINVDEALEAAIEVGAEDVTLEKTEVEEFLEVCVEFICAPKELHLVKRGLEEKGYNVSSARIEYIAKTGMPMSEQQLEQAMVLLKKLEDHADVVKVHENIHIEQ